jgi:hypothetical protein
MTIPDFGGCPWPVDPACFSDDWEAMDQEVQDRSLALASATLVRLTGGRVSNCPIKVRPMPAYGTCFVPSQSFAPGVGVNGLWRNNCSGSTEQGCAVKLPPPATQVTQVKINGVVVNPTTYRLSGRTLYFTGSPCPVPMAQDLSLEDTQPGTFSVTYLNAYPVDSLGAYAAGLLTMEFAKACTGGKCRLPAGVTQIVRQGVSMQIVTGAFPGGETGIREVDAFIGLWNPAHLRAPAMVWSPDMEQMGS